MAVQGDGAYALHMGKMVVRIILPKILPPEAAEACNFVASRLIW